MQRIQLPRIEDWIVHFDYLAATTPSRALSVGELCP